MGCCGICTSCGRGGPVASGKERGCGRRGRRCSLILQRSATPGPSRLSATRSGAAVCALDCLYGGLRVLIILSQKLSAKGRRRKADATASSNSSATHKTLNRTKSEAGNEAEGTRKTDAGHNGRSYERALSILDTSKPSKPVAAAVNTTLLAVKPVDHGLPTASRRQQWTVGYEGRS